MTELRRVLMIAYHFPPAQGGSGVQRTLRFARWLPEFGWQPTIFTIHPRAYERVLGDPGNAVPPGIEVHRAHGFDAARHFALAGRYPRALSIPDRWSSWWLGAVPAGLALIRKLQPHAMWSTYPIATAHRIGATLQRLTGRPWVADFRDPMVQEDFPPDPRTRRSFIRIEERVFARASACTFTTPSAAAMYRGRYPEAQGRIWVIENGYDEEAFSGLLPRAEVDSVAAPRLVVLLHSGSVYPFARKPFPLLAALGSLARSRRIGIDDVKLRFRAPGDEEHLRAAAAAAGVSELVEIAPSIGYREALQEMLLADALLVMQGANCNRQIPTKVYEYLRTRRPILGLADPAGDTAHALADAGVTHIAPLESANAIASVLLQFLDDFRAGRVGGSAGPGVGASRRQQTEQLARLMDGLASASLASR